ncbi:class I SAM-dependent methyltransferase [Candidatus Pelagibacter sp. HIMB1521]|uniref:class I SAM-dependent methyltransferase n=1 Tax=Candidatus Pelagibacter sp. HIMB1521 TaxID=3413344 RepID=UPI003F87D52B
MKIFKWLNFLKKNYDNSIPLYTKNSNPGLKIHLGCGNINLQGWLNIDARDFKHVHIISDGFDLTQFKENSIAEFYLCHVLEHFSFNETHNFLKKLYNLLKPGGLIRISVPDIEKLYILYNKQKKLSIIKNAIMGGQNYPNDFHKSIYDHQELKNILEKNNFKNVSSWKTIDVFGQSIGDWSDGVYKYNMQNYDISLNLVGEK